MAGSVLLPVSSGSGLTMANMVISNELWIGNAQAFGSVTVTNGGTLYLGANVGEDDFYFSSLNIHSKTAYSRNQMLYSIEILFS